MKKYFNRHDEEQLNKLIGRNKQIVSALRRLNQKVYEDLQHRDFKKTKLQNFQGYDLMQLIIKWITNIKCYEYEKKPF